MANILKCHKCSKSGHWPSSCQYNDPAVRLYTGKRLRKGDGGAEGDDDVIVVKIEGNNKQVRKGVYVIQHGDGQIYVGRSLDIDTRIIQHQNGDGAHVIQDWSNAKEISTLTEPMYDDLESWERNETLFRMRQIGIGKVRGWMFQNKVLTSPERAEAFNQICEKFDVCRRCGRAEHHSYRCSFHGSFAEWMESA